MRILLNQYIGTEKVAIEFDMPDMAEGKPIEGNSPAETRGLFSRLGDDCLGLFTLYGKLFICVNGKAAAVPHNERPGQFVFSKGWLT